MIDATPLARLYARHRLRVLAVERPDEAQRRVLKSLIHAAAATRFGRDHDFARIADVAGFQARVPLRRYDDFWSGYWEPNFPRIADVTWPGPVAYFALTSGTSSGTTKYIPCPPAMVRANVRAAADVLVHHVANRPQSRLLGGRSFMLGGSTDLATLGPGICAGDLSGIAANEVPWWARPRHFPPKDLALISDWEKKVAALAPASLDADIRSINGTPSWLLVFFDRLHALQPDRPGRLASWYPNLELVVHGGVNFAPYRSRFQALLEGSHAETREVYAASEGFIAVADRGDGEGMRLILDNGIFYEFVPVAELGAAQPTRHWVGTAETGVEYALVLSSCAGVFAYLIGDTVRLVSRNPLRLLVTGRTSYFLSAFGEHLIEAEIEDAVSHAAQRIGTTINDFSVGAVHPGLPGETGRHLYVVEFADAVGRDASAAFANAIDERLSRLNDDYRSHRSGDFGMGPPEICIAGPGRFAAWMRRRGKLGGQNKVPRVINDLSLLADLCRFVTEGSSDHD